MRYKLFKSRDYWEGNQLIGRYNKASLAYGNWYAHTRQDRLGNYYILKDNEVIYGKRQ